MDKNDLSIKNSTDFRSVLNLIRKKFDYILLIIDYMALCFAKLYTDYLHFVIIIEIFLIFFCMKFHVYFTQIAYISYTDCIQIINRL